MITGFSELAITRKAATSLAFDREPCRQLVEWEGSTVKKEEPSVIYSLIGTGSLQAG